MTDKIIAEVDNGIGWLTFNNPERRNAVSLDMAVRVAEVIEDFTANDDVRVIVLKGAGGKAFVSGADISEFEKRRSDAEKAHGYERNSLSMYEAVRACPKPVIAMIQGYCMGGGMALACACDLRICAPDSVFAIPAARLGIGYRASFTRWVVETVGAPAAKEILFTARRYDADEALRIGLVNRVVPTDELQGYVAEYAGTIAGNAPLSVLAAKGIVNEVVKSPSDWDMALCTRLVEQCSDSADFAEGRKAFMEKRPPAFTGE